MDWKERRELNRQRWKEVNPYLTGQSGIYILTRYEDGIKYAYIGQAKNILSRLADHISGNMWIDLSIKKHGLYSDTNPEGWYATQRYCHPDDLNDLERELIREHALKGYQLRNKTAGGQNEGKQGISENKPSKGYRDGIAQGRKNALKEVAHLFDLYLVATTKTQPPKKREANALEKLNNLLKPLEKEQQE